MGGGAGKGVGLELDDTESEDAGNTIPMMEEISDNLELRMLELPVTGGDGFPQMARVSLVVRGERAPKL